MRDKVHKGGLFVDTALLRDHVSKLREEKKIALELYEKLLALKNISDPTISYKYNNILREVEELIAYFEKMADTLNNVDDEAIVLSRKFEEIIETDTYNTRREISKSILL